MGKKKFKNKWTSQTKLGEPYGLSAVAVGKKLIEAGLKDPETKEPTERALEEGYATQTNLKDGTRFFMWSKKKVGIILGETCKKLDEISLWVSITKKGLKKADEYAINGEDKLARLTEEFLVDEIPKHIRKIVVKQAFGI